MSENVFDAALLILDRHGWHQGDRLGPDGERCLRQALDEANVMLHPVPELRWYQRELPWPVVAARRERALTGTRILRSAMRDVSGPFRGAEWTWNDDPARSGEDVRLALKLASRALDEAS